MPGILFYKAFFSGLFCGATENIEQEIEIVDVFCQFHLCMSLHSIIIVYINGFILHRVKGTR